MRDGRSARLRSARDIAKSVRRRSRWLFGGYDKRFGAIIWAVDVCRPKPRRFSPWKAAGQGLYERVDLSAVMISSVKSGSEYRLLHQTSCF
jgi:hypothetical protein